MGVHFHFVEQGSQEWHDGREDMYTGSNAYKLLGTIGIYNYAKAKQTEFTGNFWTKRGHLLEDEAIELYEEITGDKIIRDADGVKVGFITNDDFPGCIYSPDAVTARALVEVKSFDLPQHMKLIRGEIDLKILAQIHYGLTISKKPIAHFVPYNPKAERVEDKFKIITIKRDPAIIKNFKRILQKGGDGAKVQTADNRKHRIASVS